MADMHKKYHEKFKILDILAVTTQARGHPVPVPGKKCPWQKSINFIKVL